MATNHRAVKATLDRGLSSEWNDDHIVQYCNSITHECFFMGVALAVEWDTAQTAGGGVAPVNTFTDHHVQAEFDSGAGANDTSSMRHQFSGVVGNITSFRDAPIFTSHLWLEQFPIATECIEFGFFEDVHVPFTANTDGAYFRVDTNKIYAVTGDGVGETATDVTPATGIPEYACYKIELTSTDCKFYIGDMKTPVATHTSVPDENLPVGDLTMKYSCKNIGGGGGNQVLMYLDGSSLTRLVYSG
ncbi:MAG: hypothetical protein ACTSPV_14325 [Candidatus Hodarchaeales archaeon]